MTKISWLMLFKRIIPDYIENHMKPESIMCDQNAELLIVKAGGTYTYSYRWASKSQTSADPLFGLHNQEHKTLMPNCVISS
jgi:hypothetical protein